MNTEQTSKNIFMYIIVTYIRENIITKLQKLYSPPRNLRARNEFPVVFIKKPLCMGNLSLPHKIFTERSETFDQKVITCNPNLI